jgi:hypothetical protein
MDDLRSDRELGRQHVLAAADSYNEVSVGLVVGHGHVLGLEPRAKR